MLDALNVIRSEDLGLNVHYHDTHNDQPFRFTWQAFSADNSPTNIKIETSVQVYRNKPIVYFTIDYISGLTNASIPGVINQALSSYPSFILEDGDMKKGFVTWSKGRKYTHMHTHIQMKGKIVKELLLMWSRPPSALVPGPDIGSVVPRI